MFVQFGVLPLLLNLILILLQYVLEWTPPQDPNGVVLKYDIEITLVRNSSC